MKRDNLIRLQLLNTLLQGLKGLKKPAGYRTILEFGGNAKTVKGEKYGYKTGICYLAPADSSGFINVCQFATTCKAVCLAFQGRAKLFKTIWEARLSKTK